MMIDSVNDALYLALFTHGPLSVYQVNRAHEMMVPATKLQLTKKLDHLVAAGWLMKMDGAPGLDPTYVITPRGRQALEKFLKTYGHFFKRGVGWVSRTYSGVFDEDAVRPRSGIDGPWEHEYRRLLDQRVRATRGSPHSPPAEESPASRPDVSTTHHSPSSADTGPN